MPPRVISTAKQMQIHENNSWVADAEPVLPDNKIPDDGESVSFAKALELYLAYKSPTVADSKRIRRIANLMGHKNVRDIRHTDIIATADALYPGKTNETKNRWVVKPAAAVLHYASQNDWCDWKRIPRLKEKPARTRASDERTAQVLLQALAHEEAEATSPRKRKAAHQKWLLILWLFRHYNRISDPLRLNWEENINMDKGTYSLLISKAGQWREKPLHDEVLSVLANITDRHGSLFPWRTRSGVYKWLRPLVRRQGLKFTPHMARHFGGKVLNASGQGLKTIMGALDHADPHSSMRYQDADLEIVRRGINSVGKLTGQRLL